MVIDVIRVQPGDDLVHVLNTEANERQVSDVYFNSILKYKCYLVGKIACKSKLDKICQPSCGKAYIRKL